MNMNILSLCATVVEQKDIIHSWLNVSLIFVQFFFCQARLNRYCLNRLRLLIFLLWLFDVSKLKMVVMFKETWGNNFSKKWQRNYCRIFRMKFFGLDWRAIGYSKSYLNSRKCWHRLEVLKLAYAWARVIIEKFWAQSADRDLETFRVLVTPWLHTCKFWSMALLSLKLELHNSSGDIIFAHLALYSPPNYDFRKHP